MVVWSEHYRFSAEEVEAISTADTGTGTHPFVLTVYFKSGLKLSVSYVDLKSRKAAMIDLSRQIDREKESIEKIQRALYLLQDSANRIDKRQLRIWKQLKALLGVSVEELDDGK